LFDIYFVQCARDFRAHFARPPLLKRKGHVRPQFSSSQKGFPMHRQLSLVRCLLAVLASLLCSVVPGQTQQSLQVMHNHVRPVVATGQAVPMGLLPSTQRMDLAILLPLRNQAELTSFLSRLNDPTSPDYRHFLSVAEFTEQFGPTQQDYDTVISFAKSNGFKVTGTPENRLLVDISGSVAQVERAFHVKMGVYQHPSENRTFYSPDREPSLDLKVAVSHIAGLNNFSIPRPHLKRAAAGQAIHQNVGSGPGGAYLGSDMRAAYYGGTALTGAGQSVGLCEFDGYTLSDVTKTFDGQTNNVAINNVLIDGASGGSDGDDGEQVLDIVQAASMAPGMDQVRVYIAPISSRIGVGDTDMFNKMATENITKQIGCSWGWSPDDITQDDPIFQEFAAQGQNMFVASGDSGAYTGNNNQDESYPAESVYVVAVGGTDLVTNGAGGPWKSETAWPDSSGGPSDNGFAIPSWQVGAADSSNGGSTTVRNLPDVAAEGDFDNYLCSPSCAGDWGGTSFAAPRWAGFLALINQQVVANGGSTLGFVNPAIYAIGFGSNFDNDFHDITSGNNNNGRGESFNAVTGYDLVTGWGSPNGQNLIDALAGAASPSFSLSASPASLSIAQGSAGTSKITVTDVDGFSGSVTLSASGLPSGVTAAFSPNPTSSTSTLTLTASASAVAGTATVTITGKSGSLTATTTLKLTVTTSGGGPTVMVSPASLAWANVIVGATSAKKAVTLTNTGTSTLNISSITTSGDFAQTTSTKPCGSTLAAGKNCKIEVTFTPTQVGARTGTLTISDNASGGSQTVALSGTGTVQATLTPVSATFPAEKVGVSSPAKVFTLHNKQAVALSGISISSTGDFNVSATTCTASLAAKTNCTISVVFKPSATGTRTGTLKVTDSAVGGPQTSSLTGTGK
jgi:Pro-kumamolisin, activation domain/Abnormal spindle-like microcephaly-assoc'd, ASPM-SPD-2-Hydin